jgi:hypothetical protein
MIIKNFMQNALKSLQTVGAMAELDVEIMEDLMIPLGKSSSFLI